MRRGTQCHAVRYNMHTRTSHTKRRRGSCGWANYCTQHVSTADRIWFSNAPARSGRAGAVVTSSSRWPT